jgi:hypothetical protein
MIRIRPRAGSSPAMLCCRKVSERLYRSHGDSSFMYGIHVCCSPDFLLEHHPGAALPLVLVLHLHQLLHLVLQQQLLTRVCNTDELSQKGGYNIEKLHIWSNIYFFRHYFVASSVADPEFLSRIPDQNFFQIQSQKDFRIPDPDPHQRIQIF